jgi:transcriptional regulator with XRE-family HTH domain
VTGHQIRAMRLALGLSQGAMAAAIGVSDVTVWLWERKGEANATPARRSEKWEALIAFLSTAQPARPEPESKPKKTCNAGLLWPWLPTAGPEYRSRVREIVRAA